MCASFAKDEIWIMKSMWMKEMMYSSHPNTSQSLSGCDAILSMLHGDHAMPRSSWRRRKKTEIPNKECFTGNSHEKFSPHSNGSESPACPWVAFNALCVRRIETKQTRNGFVAFLFSLISLLAAHYHLTQNHFFSLRHSSSPLSVVSIASFHSSIISATYLCVLEFCVFRYVAFSPIHASSSYFVLRSVGPHFAFLIQLSSCRAHIFFPFTRILVCFFSSLFCVYFIHIFLLFLFFYEAIFHTIFTYDRTWRYKHIISD